nr:InkG [Nonomuraea longicatena]
MFAAHDFSGQSKAEAFPAQARLTGAASFVAGMRDIFYRTAPDQMDDLLRVLDRFPADVLVSDDMCYGASFAAEHTGLPHVWIGNSIYVLGSRDTAPLGRGLGPSATRAGRLRNAVLAWAGDHIMLRGLRRAADAARAQAGLARLRAGGMENIARRPDRYLVGTVAELEFPRSDLFAGTHFVGALDLPPSDTAFDPPPWWEELRGERPVVLVTQGTIADDARRLLLPAIRALADEPVLVVVTTGNRTLGPSAGTLPANVRVEGFVPYHRLLPYVDVMVTNGGFNGVTAALRHGVPLVVAGATEEKADVAARVAYAGAGVALRGARLAPERVRAAVRAVLDGPEHRAAAARLHDAFARHDGPRRAAELIEELIPARTAPATGGPL